MARCRISSVFSFTPTREFVALLLMLILFIVVGATRAEMELPVGAGLELHLSADSLTWASDGEAIAQWSDLSAAGRHAVAPNAENRPVFAANQINGRPVVQFDGTDDYLAFAAAANIRTVFWVGREDANATAIGRFLLGHSSRYDFHRGPNRRLWSSQYAAASLLSATTCINGRVVHGINTPAPTEYAAISVRSVGPLAADQLSLDRALAGRVWHGDIAELILYNRVLSIEEERQVGHYLQQKYGIAGRYEGPVVVGHAPARAGLGHRP